MALSPAGVNPVSGFDVLPADCSKGSTFVRASTGMLSAYHSRRIRYFKKLTPAYRRLLRQCSREDEDTETLSLEEFREELQRVVSGEPVDQAGESRQPARSKAESLWPVRLRIRRHIHWHKRLTPVRKQLKGILHWNLIRISLFDLDA
ncbi:hypothetical protein H5P28_09040 [Ruficoccus amylovorans]|uniref:Uncharacterized protein n=1 Tax=Ruficoccus amylovorans TaxID=1804625 RepID=A0A842HDV3_9BACT|nr:hypothetical protein [Ruficoccus amylovorans]MBC2594400.1 hypothetical protein [Ruficoccus amylovorans]